MEQEQVSKMNWTGQKKLMREFAEFHKSNSREEGRGRAKDRRIADMRI